MTDRLIYRTLVRLHPTKFREQHGDEMLCIFDESAPEESRHLLADGILSIGRQWVFHSGWWKLLVGATISSALLLGWAWSMNRDFDWSMRWGAQRGLLLMGSEKPVPHFSQLEFEREADQAVRMLAQSDHRQHKKARLNSDGTVRPATGSDNRE